mgnify:CR=1 FL=1
MVELISIVCVFGFFALIALVAWGIVTIYDIIRTKRWERAKATDAHLRQLIERRDEAWRQYLEAHVAFSMVKKEIDELLDTDTHRYLVQSDIDTLRRQAEELKPKYHILRKESGEKYAVHERARKEFDVYCEKKRYFPWGE